MKLGYTVHKLNLMGNEKCAQKNSFQNHLRILSGQLVPSRQIELVPFRARERNFGRLADIFQTARVGGTDNGLHSGRVAKDPCNRNSCVRHTFCRGDLVDFLVEFGELFVIQEDTLKEAELE